MKRYRNILTLCVVFAMLLCSPIITFSDRVIADHTLEDEKYHILNTYHGGTREACDADAAYAYLYVKTVCGQEKADEVYELLLNTADLGNGFDYATVYALQTNTVKEYNKALAAELRPTPPPVEEIPIDPAASYQKYADVADGAWYAEAVNAMSNGGLLKGYDDGLFHPNDYITYGQWAIIMSRVAKLVQEDKTESYAQLLKLCQEMGIKCSITPLNGNDNANGLISRGETLNCVNRIVYHDLQKLRERLAEKYAGKVWTAEDIPDWNVVDANQRQISTSGTPNQTFWYNENILEDYNLGITQGVDAAGTCNPMGYLSRAEACQMLYNMGLTYAGSAYFGNMGYVGGSTGSIN